MYQAELDAFFRDSREADFSLAPNVLDSLVYLDHTYYQFETDIDFPRLHIDCESAEEEELDDTIPYKEPPPPYHAVRVIEPIGNTQSEQHRILQALDNRLDPSYQQSQVLKVKIFLN